MSLNSYKEPFQIAIDGPTASGKGTVARILARKFGFVNLYTGAIYRAVTVWFLDNNSDYTDREQVKQHLDNLNLEVKCVDGKTRVFINGDDVTKRLHNVEISTLVPEIACIPEVRAKVRSIQKSVASGQDLICEGRDITSVIFPDARFKFYLTAKLKKRAQRRYLQEIKNGEKVTLEQVTKGIAERDRADMTRPLSPLVHVKGAVKIDCTKKSAQRVADIMEKIIKKGFAKDAKKKRSSGCEKYIQPEDFRLPLGANFLRKFLKVFLYVPYRMIFWTRIINKKELKQHRGKSVIFAVNHRSYSDVTTLFMTFSTRRLHFIGKEQLFKPRTFMNWFLRSLNGFPFRPGKNDLAIIRHSLAMLKAGDTLVIFPEGRRNFKAEDMLEVRDGTSVIAMKAGVPIVPVVSRRAPRPFKYNAFKIGKTILTEDFSEKNELSAKIKREMAAMLDGFDCPPKEKKWDKEPVYNSRAVVFKDGKLIAIKRNKDGQEFFVFPGGHIEEGETAREAVVREVKEETNIRCEAVRVLYKRKFREKMQAFYLCGYISGEVSKTDAEEYTKCVSAEKNAASVGFDEEYTCHVSGEPDREYGTYEPVLLETENLRDIDVRPKEIKEQLLKDIKKYGIRLTRPTKYLK